MDFNSSTHNTKLIDTIKKRICSTLSQFQLLETCVYCTLFTSVGDKWLFTGLSGCLFYIVDYKEKHSLLTLYDMVTCKKLFEFKTYPSFQKHYKKLTDSFHTFELNKGHIGLKFSNYLSAGEFDAVVQKYPEEKKKALFNLQVGSNFTVKNRFNTDPYSSFRKSLKTMKPNNNDLKKSLAGRLCFDLNKPSFYRVPACFDFNKIYKTFKNVREKDLERISINLCFKRTISENTEVNLNQLKSIVETYKIFQFNQKMSIFNILKTDDAKFMDNRVSLLKASGASYSRFTSAANIDISNLSIFLDNSLDQNSKEEKNKNLLSRGNAAKPTPALPAKPQAKIPPVPNIPLPKIPAVPKINIPIPKLPTQVTIQADANEKPGLENETPEKTKEESLLNSQPAVEEPKMSMLDMLKNVKLAKAEKVEDTKPLLLKQMKSANDIEFALSQHLKRREEQMGGAETTKFEEEDEDDDW